MATKKESLKLFHIAGVKYVETKITSVIKGLLPIEGSFKEGRKTAKFIYNGGENVLIERELDPNKSSYTIYEKALGREAEIIPLRHLPDEALQYVEYVISSAENSLRTEIALEEEKKTLDTKKREARLHKIAKLQKMQKQLDREEGLKISPAALKKKIALLNEGALAK